VRTLLLCVVFFLITGNAFAQKDTAFWFAAPEVSQDGAFQLDRPVALKITSYSTPTTVTISLPANSAVAPIVTTIGANATSTIILDEWIDDIENSVPDVAANKGILIQSEYPVTVYYEVISGGEYMPRDNPEAFVLKGRNALGTAFYIPGQDVVNNATNYTPQPVNSFDIIATEDGTTVNITPSNDVVGHVAADGTYTVSLNRGQTYSAKSTSENSLLKLGGSHVTSNKDIAITVKDDLLLGSLFNGGCADLTGDQIVPVNIVGTEYIAIKTELGGWGDFVYVMATENGTEVFRDGASASVATLNAGESFWFNFEDFDASYIAATRPVYVWQLAGSGCELGAGILPPIQCTGSDTVAYVRSSQFELYMKIITESPNTGSFTINGAPLSGTVFNDVPGTDGNWKFASVFLPLAEYPYNSVIKVINSTGVFHLSTIDINGGGTSYGYFSNYGSLSPKITADNLVCIGDTVKLNGTNISGAQYSWYGPDGFTSSEQNPKIPDAGTANSGWYYLTVTDAFCNGTDSIYISVTGPPDFSFELSDPEICKGDTVTLNITGNDGMTSVWPLSGVIQTDSSTFRICPDTTSQYYISVVNSAGCTAIDSFDIKVDSLPVIIVSATDSTIGCPVLTTQLFASGAEQYHWQPEALCSDPHIFNPVVSPHTRTTFIVTGTTSSGCSNSAGITIDYESRGVQLIPNAFSPNGDGINDEFMPYIECDYQLEFLKIFNRYGELVFSTENVGDGWKGNQKGVPSDVGVYFWLLRGKSFDGTTLQIKGDVTLIR